MDGVRPRDQIIQGVRDLRAHYELRISPPDGGTAVLLRVARHTQAVEAAAAWPGVTPLQIVQVRGMHRDTVILVGMLMVLATVAVGMVVTADMVMGFFLLYFLGMLIAMVDVGKDLHGTFWADATDGLRLSTEDTTRIEALADARAAALIRRR